MAENTAKKTPVCLPAKSIKSCREAHKLFKEFSDKLVLGKWHSNNQIMSVSGGVQLKDLKNSKKFKVSFLIFAWHFASFCKLFPF